MIELMLRDSELRPDLFWWHGAIPIAEIDAWEREHQLRVLPDLKLLWSTKGAVDFFESETILKPFGEPEYELLLSVSIVWWERGLSTDYCVFAIGGCEAIFRKADGAIFALSQIASTGVTVGSEFSGLDEWYVAGPRMHFGLYYGLPAV
jgi:hypothetical protein